MQPEQAYKELVDELRELGLFSSVSAVLAWDERTQMPAKGADHRAAQSAAMAKLVHERFTSKRIGELLATVEASPLVRDRDSDAAVNVRETRRAYDRATKLPTALVEALSHAEVLGQQAWGEAKGKNDYPQFRPWLEKLLDLKRQEAKCVGSASGEMYDALLDQFEPGETAAGIRKTFDALRAPLVDFVGRIVQSGRTAPVEILERSYPAAAQERLSREAAARVGFEFAAGRLDVSLHPFCTGLGPGDTRMTTRYDDKYFGDAFFGVLHETGHALYDQGLDRAHFGTPRGEACSLGIHESQSRMWENLVGRSRAFWRFYFPRAKEVFAESLADVDPERWYFAINDVRPSLIRTESDEATYNLHIMLRFELEQALLNDELKPADLPAAWNERMKSYLGVEPPDDTRGCLQDIHWSGGAIGYFPTYTLGNLYAAQFFEEARKDLGDLDAQFARGEFAPLLKWLRENIHRHGKRYTAGELAQRVTGKPLDAAPLLRHLRAKASELYGVN
jgi:carboxypeptidase Taq